MKRARLLTVVSASMMALVWVISPARAQVQMPNPKEISGQPLPSADLPAGTFSVRVIRGDFSHNLPGQKVDITVDGKVRSVTTDATGHVQISGLSPNAHVQAVTVVDGERLESQPVAMGTSGIRVMLVATDPDIAKRAAEDAALAHAAPVKGMVVFGPESRVIMEMRDDRLNVYYLLDVQNTARTPVDIGGPLVIDLPAEARGASLLEASTKKATVTGARVTVLGPFPPGTTPLQIAFELPYSGASVRLAQKLPAALPQVIVIASQTGGLDLQSPQISNKREVTDQGERIIAGTGPGLPSGQTLQFDLTGLPHHAVWPRYTALATAGVIMTLGIWAAAVAPRRRRA